MTDPPPKPLDYATPERKARESLIVNLSDPAAEWTLNSNAVLNIGAAGGMLGGGGIQGIGFQHGGHRQHQRQQHLGRAHRHFRHG
jgi:hypothetical protein